MLFLTDAFTDYNLLAQRKSSVCQTEKYSWTSKPRHVIDAIQHVASFPVKNITLQIKRMSLFKWKIKFTVKCWLFECQISKPTNIQMAVQCILNHFPK